MSVRRILLVDDNADHALLTVDVLTRVLGEHAEIRIAQDGREALELLADEDWQPDLALVDIRLPYVDGFGVLEHIKSDERLRSTAVVMLTTSDDDRDICRSRGLGSDDFLTKPARTEALRELVSQTPLTRLEASR